MHIEEPKGDTIMPESDIYGIERRTIIRGAAWSVPAVALAVATPAAASSTTFTCPTITPGSGWVATVPVSGTISTDGGDTAFDVRVGAHGPEFFSNLEPKPNTGQLHVRRATTVNVVAGHTYTFTFSSGSHYGGLDPNISKLAELRFNVDGSTLFVGSSRPQTGLTTIPNNSSSTHSNTVTTAVSYTATTTGSIPVSFVWAVRATNTTEIRGDDISVSVPVITCS